MRTLYFILAVAGWAWLVAVVLIVYVRSREKVQRGFDVGPAGASTDLGGEGVARAAPTKDSPPL